MKKYQKLIYHTGDFLLPKSLIKILDIELIRKNKFYINGWSFMHFLSGIIVGYLLNDNCYYYKLFIIHTLWELWQIMIGMSKPFLFAENDNIIDLFIDTIFFMFGGYVVKTI